MLSKPSLVVVELLQQTLGNTELLLGLGDGAMAVVETLLVAVHVTSASLVLFGAKMLDLFT